MKPEVVDKLSESRDFYALIKAILALCEPFGAVHSFRFVHNRGAARVACLIELEEAKQQLPLAQAIGGNRVNGAVCLEIPVRRDFGSPIRVVSIPSSVEARQARERGLATQLAS